MVRLFVLLILLLPTVMYSIINRGKHGHRQAYGTSHSHGEFIPIDHLAYSSRLRELNPSFKFLVSLLTILLLIVLDTPPVSLVVLFAAAYMAVEVGGLSLQKYIHILTIPIAFIALGTVAIAVAYAAQPLGEYRVYLGLGFLYTNTAMLQKGAFLMLKSIAAVSALEFLVLTTPLSDIILVLQKAHVPRLLIDIMHLTYRYIFVLMDIHMKMRNAALSRLGYRDIRTSFRTFGSIAGNLLILSLKRAGTFFDAMEARCYTGELTFIEQKRPVLPGQAAAAVLFFLYLPLLKYIA